MDYSAAERERAREQVRNYGELRGYASSWPLAIDLQMELNRAVKLMREAYGDDCDAPNCSYCQPIRDFLSHYPEGELR